MCYNYIPCYVENLFSMFKFRVLIMSLLLCSTRRVLTITPFPLPLFLSLPLYQFDLVGSNCVCSHTCTPFYTHSSHCGNMLIDSCTSKICCILAFMVIICYGNCMGEWVREREKERENESQAAGCVVGPIWMIGLEMQAETGFPLFL